MPGPSFVPIVAVLGLAAGLAACERQSPPAPAQPAASLWRIDVLQDETTVVSTLNICADRSIQDSFARPTPELNGRPCIRTDEPIVTKGETRTYSVRCRIDEQFYLVGAAAKGDAERDFTVEMVVTRRGTNGPTFEQVRRYRRQGVCPAGWQIGDSAAPGAAEIVNTLTGVRRKTAAPGG